jgi:hypothetical protein
MPSNVTIMRSSYILYLVRTRVETERRCICTFGFSTDVGFPNMCILRIVMVVVGPPWCGRSNKRVSEVKMAPFQ